MGQVTLSHNPIGRQRVHSNFARGMDDLPMILYGVGGNTYMCDGVAVFLVEEDEIAFFQFRKSWPFLKRLRPLLAGIAGNANSAELACELG